jgi:hypothetical protein
MTPQTIARLRLANQHLAEPVPADPVQLVRRLGAVQSQDYAGAKWALALRLRCASDVAIEDALSSGAILRTHVLRPTWHFVAAQDIRWMLALTAPRVRAAMASSNRKLGLDDAAFRRSRAVIAKALRDGQELTRTELAAALARARTEVGDPQRLAHLVMHAELDGLICSGARRGKQFTYALLEERVPAIRSLAHDEALAELATRYFTTRGPATAQDFAWWSGLSVAQARQAAESLGSMLAHERVDGRTYWFTDGAPAVPNRRAGAHLLPNYDEFFIGFRDRSAVLQSFADLPLPAPTGARFPHVVAIDGQLVGGWRRELSRDAVQVGVELSPALGLAQRRSVEAAAERYAAFVGLPLVYAEAARA